jgi:hypothetical protein
LPFRGKILKVEEKKAEEGKEKEKVGWIKQK